MKFKIILLILCLLVLFNPFNIYANVFYNNEGNGIRLDNGNLENNYNDVFNNIVDYLGCSAGTGSVSSDPLFIDEASDNYHLQGLSPCKDTGNPDPQYNAPDGSTNDMGCYPYE